MSSFVTKKNRIGKSMFVTAITIPVGGGVLIFTNREYIQHTLDKMSSFCSQGIGRAEGAEGQIRCDICFYAVCRLTGEEHRITHSLTFFVVT